MKIVQKIETGGTSSTSTPIFRYFANMLFPPSDALHIAHWASADPESNTHDDNTARMAIARATRLMIVLGMRLTTFSCRGLRRGAITQLLGPEAVRKKHHQQADGDYQYRHNRQNQVQALEP